MGVQKEVFRNLPGVDKLLAAPELEPLLSRHGRAVVSYTIRQTLDELREYIRSENQAPEWKEIIQRIYMTTELLSKHHIKRVYNASGIIIHTNLGRAPFGSDMLMGAYEVLKGYNNLEFDLQTGSRGSRNDHASTILKYLTGAEDILIVNNAAAAVMLILRTFAKNREVIVSRGELVEIGGSFRIPDIMAASDCKMVEVGTTNKTRLSDYESKININTALLFKAHKSNYTIKGFTEEVSAAELSRLCQQYNIPFLYDLGSGLLRKVPIDVLRTEPDVKGVLASGVDMVCFSGDKLLGGPQAGIIAGRKHFIAKLKKDPMLRALRVCKTIIALLETACLYYLNDEVLNAKNLVYKAFNREKTDILNAAEKLELNLNKHDIATQIVQSNGQCGGGTLPDATIGSYAVKILYGKSNKESSAYAEKIYLQLLANQKPVLGILKQGSILFDMLTIDPPDVEVIGQVIIESHKEVLQKL